MKKRSRAVTFMVIKKHETMARPNQDPDHQNTHAHRTRALTSTRKGERGGGDETRRDMRPDSSIPFRRDSLIQATAVTRAIATAVAKPCYRIVKLLCRHQIAVAKPLPLQS